MKRFFILSILFIFSCNSYEKRIPLSRIEIDREYKGKVKKITQIQCEDFDNHLPIRVSNNSCSIWQIIEFSPNEIITREANWYSSKGDYYPYPPSILKTKVVDNNGQIIEEYHKGYDPEDNRKTIYTYNEFGFEAERIKYFGLKFSSRTETKYDEYNCPIEKLYYDESNNLVYYYTKEFDSNNRIIYEKKFNNNNILDSEWKYEYSSNIDERYSKRKYYKKGKIVREKDRIKMYSNNTADFAYTFGLPYEGFNQIEYYSDGKIKEWKYINSESEEIYQTYDQNQKVTEIKIFRNGKWLETLGRKYGNNGILIEESKSTHYSKTPFVKYSTIYSKFDTYGNWIESYQTSSEKGIFDIQMRKIEYYD